MAVEMPRAHVGERVARGLPGWPIFFAVIVAVLVSIGMLSTGSGPLIAVAVVLLFCAILAAVGLTPVAPGQARVLQLLGRYVGTVRTDGLCWVNPLTTRRRVSTRIRNHETGVAKVNDADGNPIEIAAVVVWQVEDTAKAVFEVDDFVEFVAIQTGSLYQ
jgi:regulator of protease activity HflC (stomatin/prohibitin superfamily)